MTSTPRKAVPRKAVKPAVPSFEAPAEEQTPEPSPSVRPAAEPAPPEPDTNGQDDARGVTQSEPELVAERVGYPPAGTGWAEKASERPVPAPVESPAPGSAAHEALVAEAATQQPRPVFAGTFAIYQDGRGGFMLVVQHEDGTIDQKHIPAGMVKLAQSGFMEKMMGGGSGGGFLTKLIGH